LLGAEQRREEEGSALADGLGHEVPVGQLGGDGGLDDGPGDLQQLAGCLGQVLVEGGAVTLACNLLEGVTDPCLGTLRGVRCEPQALGDGVGGLEADAVDVQASR